MTRVSEFLHSVRISQRDTFCDIHSLSKNKYSIYFSSQFAKKKKKKNTIFSFNAAQLTNEEIFDFSRQKRTILSAIRSSLISLLYRIHSLRGGSFRNSERQVHSHEDNQHTGDDRGWPSSPPLSGSFDNRGEYESSCRRRGECLPSFIVIRTLPMLHWEEGGGGGELFRRAPKHSW